jgi:hypothetical protein
MYKVVGSTAGGEYTVWRTPVPAATSTATLPPPQGAKTLTPWGWALQPAAPADPAPQLATGDDGLPEGAVSVARRKIAGGEIIIAKMDLRYVVVKNQALGTPVVNQLLTPTPAFCERQALTTLNRLMQSHRLAPAFCELAPGATPGGLPLMCAYVTDLGDWLRGNGRDPERRCPHKPDYPAAAVSAETWIYTRCAGHQLANSAFPSDRKLFNSILRDAIFQVLLALAQAQRHVLFTHNDLHSGNVMFEHNGGGVSRLLVTGCGTFLLPKRSARIRLIDFQHAVFDVYDEAGRCTGRVASSKEDVHNAHALAYDVWRFCSNLVMEALRDKWVHMDGDLLALLRQGAGFAPGTEVPRLDAQVHWRPYLLSGPTAEQLLQDAAFDRYRCDAATACADEVHFECAPSADAQERYLRAVHRGPRGAAAFPQPERVVDAEARARLRVYALNYEGTAMGRAAMCHKHPPAMRARYLMMELSLLEAAMDHLWSPACAAEVAARRGCDSAMCALADAIGVALHAEYTYIARPSSLDDYHALVLAACELPCVAEVLSRPPAPSRLGAQAEAALLCVQHEAELERFRGVFHRAIVE